MTKSLAIQQRFQELENAICQLITDTQFHQAEFLIMNNQFDKLEHQVLIMMALCKDTSQNVLELCQETNDTLFHMRQATAIQAAELWTAFAEVTQIIHSMANNRDSTPSATHVQEMATALLNRHIKNGQPPDIYHETSLNPPPSQL